MSQGEDTVGRHQTFVFDHVVTNVGGNYNGYTGAFTSPSLGVYMFSWTVFCDQGGYFAAEFVVNSKLNGALYCNAQSANTIRHVTGVVVVEINQGDVVFIRTHPTFTNNGRVYSTSLSRSSFTGWKLF